MKKGLITIFLLMFVLVSLYATNPSKYEFNDYAKENVEKTIRESGITSNSFINNLLGTLAGKATENIADIAFTRDNYCLFSIYRIKGVDLDYQFLGIFKQFIPLSNNLNALEINTKFKDEITLGNINDALDEDHYSSSKIEIDKPSELIIDIDYNSGPAFEMYIFDEENFNNWQINMTGNDSREIKYLSEWHLVINKDIKKSGNINSGVYCILRHSADTDAVDSGHSVLLNGRLNQAVSFELITIV